MYNVEGFSSSVHFCCVDNSALSVLAKLKNFANQVSCCLSNNFIGNFIAMLLNGLAAFGPKSFLWNYGARSVKGVLYFFLKN